MAPKSLNTNKDLEKAFIEWNTSIYGYVFLRVRNQSSAEEITQEVFFKAWRSRETFNPSKSSLKTWLFTIAKNEIIDYLKSPKSEFIDEETEEEIKDDSEDISSKTRGKDLSAYVFEKLKSLNERDQELIILRFKQDLSVKEIAEIMQMEYIATKVALHRAISKLTDMCNKQM